MFSEIFLLIAYVIYVNFSSINGSRPMLNYDFPQLPLLRCGIDIYVGLRLSISLDSFLVMFPYIYSSEYNESSGSDLS